MLITRRLVWAILLLSVFASLIGGFYASYEVQREQLIQCALQRNAAYALQLAQGVEQFLQTALQRLDYSASVVASHFEDDFWLQAEVKRLKMQMDGFNSVVLADGEGRIKATFPENLGIKGQQPFSVGPMQALRERKPSVSGSYQAVTGRVVVFISQPIWSNLGQYLGYVAGTLYLQEPSALQSLLGEHYQKEDGSYVYLINANRQLLYHVKKRRVGEQVQGVNPVIDAVMAGSSGSLRVVNTEGQDMLSGYASVPTFGWGVVAQTPFSAIHTQLQEALYSIVQGALLWVPLGGIFMWFFLNQLVVPVINRLTIPKIRKPHL